MVPRFRGWLLVVLTIAGLVLPVPSVLAGVGATFETVVDLARVPVPPPELPEQGFRFTQGGQLDPLDLVHAVAGLDASAAEIDVVGEHLVQAYATVHQRFGNRASRSDPTATLVTLLIEAASEEGVQSLRDGLFTTDDASERLGNVLVSTDENGSAALLSHDHFLIAIVYGRPSQRRSTGPNADAWSASSLAKLAETIADRIDDAVALADDDAMTLGTGNLRITGRHASSGNLTPFSPLTEHYRVLDGTVLPYPDEASELSADELIPGVRDVFISRQGIGDGEGNQLIGIMLVRFDSTRDAAAYARAPDDVDVTGGLGLDIAYGKVFEREDGRQLTEAVLTTREGRMSGYRSVRRVDDIVQVVEWVTPG